MSQFICHILLQYVILQYMMSHIAAICHIAVDMSRITAICHITVDMSHIVAICHIAVDKSYIVCNMSYRSRYVKSGQNLS